MNPNTKIFYKGKQVHHFTASNTPVFATYALATLSLSSVLYIASTLLN